jgi:hypothetical protein
LKRAKLAQCGFALQVVAAALGDRLKFVEISAPLLIAGIGESSKQSPTSGELGGGGGGWFGEGGGGLGGLVGGGGGAAVTVAVTCGCRVMTFCCLKHKT